MRASDRRVKKPSSKWTSLLLLCLMMATPMRTLLMEVKIKDKDTGARLSFQSASRRSEKGIWRKAAVIAFVSRRNASIGV